MPKLFDKSVILGYNISVVLDNKNELERNKKMVRHIVAWKMAQTDDKEQKMLKIKEELEALKDKIDVIADIEVGINFNESDGASDIVLVSTFKSKEDLNTYQLHPEHVAVAANYVRPNVCERRVIDYEF